MHQRSLQGVGIFQLIAAASIWGAMYVASASLMTHSPPFLILELRESIAAVALVIVATKSRALKVERGDILQIIGVGITGFTISVGTQFVGTHDAGAGMGSLVTASSPILITILSATLLRERVPWLRWIAIGIAFLGVVIILGTPRGGAKTTTGVLFLLVAAVAWSMYTIGSRRLTERYSPLTIVTWATVVGSLSSLPLGVYAVQTTRNPWPSGILSWGEVGYISLIGMALAFFLWIGGLDKVPASKGSVMLLFQPLVGVVMGIVLLGERMSEGMILGAVLICGGVVLAVIDPKSAIERGQLEETARLDAH